MSQDAPQRAAALQEIRPRNYALDGMRGVGFLLVFLHHGSAAWKPRGIAEKLVYLVGEMGWVAVDLFFVLSGFLITEILIRTRESPHYYRSFYARRVLRIFPLYFAVLTLVLVLLPQWKELVLFNYFWAQPGANPQIWYWLYLNNLYVAFRGAFQHTLLANTWSLAIEEQFYMVWPHVVRFVTLDRVRIACWVVIAVSPLGRACATLAGAGPISIYVLTPLHLDGIAVGALVALTLNRPDGVERLRRAVRWMLPVSTVLLLAVTAAARVGPFQMPRRPLIWNSWIQILSVTPVLTLTASVMVHVLLEPAGRAARVLSWGVLRYFGRISYAMYLIHGPALTFFALFLQRRGVMPAPELSYTLLLWSMAFPFTVALGSASWYGFERPILNLKRHFPYL